MNKSTLLHLRIPFSLYLMPFFCFAVSQAEEINLVNLILSFISIHLFLYPASNGYNSYYDKDEGSIGGLQSPPKVEKDLLLYSLLFDLLAILTAAFISWEFSVLVFIYGLASKAYSHPAIRLKKYPIGGLLVVIFFQGFFTYYMTIVSLQGASLQTLLSLRVLFPAFLCSMLLLGSYPMTQVYQHKEDAKRGDKTISQTLGVKGTFIWTGLIFGLGTIGFLYYFTQTYSFQIALTFPLFLSPVLIYFFIWGYKVFKNSKNADWASTMKLNKISAYCFILFFIFLGFIK